MSGAQEIAARVDACRAKAEALLGDVAALAADLPEWSEDDTSGGELEAVLRDVRAELDFAGERLEEVPDYLTPRGDDDTPECCAIRRLGELAKSRAPSGHAETA